MYFLNKRDEEADSEFLNESSETCNNEASDNESKEYEEDESEFEEEIQSQSQNTSLIHNGNINGHDENLDDPINDNYNEPIEDMSDISEENPHYIPNGVLPAITIIEPTIEFNEHIGPIMACSIYPDWGWAVTGGTDCKIHIWNVNVGNLLATINEHINSITVTVFYQTTFNDSIYLASSDCCGYVNVYQIWRLTDNVPATVSFGTMTILKIFTGNTQSGVLWMKFHPADDGILYAGNMNGSIHVWNLITGAFKILHGPYTRCRSAVFFGTLANKLFAVYYDGSACVYDAAVNTTNQILFHIYPGFNPFAHNFPILCVDCNKNGFNLMSGDVNGEVVFYNYNIPIKRYCSIGHILTVAFSQAIAPKLSASGTSMGQINIYDYSTLSSPISYHLPNTNKCITMIKWLTPYVLIAATFDGNLYGYDALSGICMFKLVSHYSTVWKFCFNDKNNTVVSVSHDSSAKVFELPDLDD